MRTKHAAQRDERSLMKHHATGLAWSKSERPEPERQGASNAMHRAQLPSQDLMRAQAVQAESRRAGREMPRTYRENKK